MSLESLIKSEEVKSSQKKIAIDYGRFDSTLALKTGKVNIQIIESALKDAQKKADAIIESAEKKANLISESAEREALDFLTAQRRVLKQEGEELRSKIEKELSDEREKLTSDKKVFEQDKLLQKKELEILKEQQKIAITEQVLADVHENAKKDIENEYQRVIQQIHNILDEIIANRKRFLVDVEKEVSQLVMLVAHKVVKVISEKDENVVIQNVIKALEKLRGRERFLIRVNLKNLKNLEEFIPKIKEQLEIEGTIKLVEDSKVDIGGCIIESEFGEIDARISTQFAEIEKRIRDVELVKNVEYK